MKNRRTIALLFLAVICLLYKNSFAVDLQSPRGDWICRVVENATDAGESKTTVDFGKINDTQSVMAASFSGKPAYEFIRLGLFPHLIVCWSQTGKYCMVASLNRKGFNLDIVNVSDPILEKRQIDISRAIESLLPRGKGQFSSDFNMAKWLANDVLQIITTVSFDGDAETRSYKCEIFWDGHEWKIKASTEQ